MRTLFGIFITIVIVAILLAIYHFLFVRQPSEATQE